MPASLKSQAEKAAIRRQIASDRLQAKQMSVALNYLNDNLKQSRKRRASWSIPASPSRDFNTQDRRKAMATARQQVDENPLALSMLTTHLDFVVGAGWTLRMLSGNKEWDSIVEAWWLSVRDTIDIRGRSHRKHLRCLQARQKVDGDVGAVLFPYDAENLHKSYVQLIEADRISKKAGGADDGIDFDEYGLAKKFYVSTRDPSDKADGKPYDAEDFIFYANDPTERAERERGMTAFLQLFNVLQDHREIMDGITCKVKKESFYGLKFTTQQGKQMFGDIAETGTAENGAEYTKVRTVPGMNLVLGKDENAEFMSSSSPNAEFSEFEIKMIERVAHPFGLTFELVTGNWQRLNYTSGRAMLEMIRKRIRPEQAELAGVASREFQWALSRAIKFGELTPPSDVENTYWNHRWGVPGIPHLNPVQDATGKILMLQNQLTSRQSILADTGEEDFDDTLDSLKYEHERTVKAGIPIVVTPGSLVNQEPQGGATDDNGEPAKKSEGLELWTA